MFVVFRTRRKVGETSEWMMIDTDLWLGYVSIEVEKGYWTRPLPGDTLVDA